MAKTFRERAEKILERTEKLASFTETEGMVTRTFGTDAFVSACAQLKLWMEDAGLETRIDNIGNVRGKWASKSPTRRTLVIGSHIDSVINAGKYDGPLGILMGLDLLEHLREEIHDLPFNIELMAFSDEEGVRFHTTYLGSKAVAGIFEEQLLGQKDAAGITIAEALHEMQLDGAKIHLDKIEKENWIGYFEIHIEQGPVLYEKNIPVGIVTSIAGQRRAIVTFKGEAGHAGTVPMDMRSDALCAAAEFILEVEKTGKSKKDLIVATVGKLSVKDAASNVIPGEVSCTLDLRSSDPELLDATYTELTNLAKNISSQRKISISLQLIQKTFPLHCDTSITQTLRQAVEKNNIPYTGLVSGAGHDGVAISNVAPIGMMFIRCFKGISHNPLESVEINDVTAGIQVAEEFIKKFISNY